MINCENTFFFFRRDSDIVAPYEKWEYFDPRVRQVEQDRNYAQNKTKKVSGEKVLNDKNVLVKIQGVKENSFVRKFEIVTFINKKFF